MEYNSADTVYYRQVCLKLSLFWFILLSIKRTRLRNLRWMTSRMRLSLTKGSSWNRNLDCISSHLYVLKAELIHSILLIVGTGYTRTGEKALREFEARQWWRRTTNPTTTTAPPAPAKSFWKRASAKETAWTILLRPYYFWNFSWWCAQSWRR